MYPTAPVARAFWFDGIANFGDALTPWLLRRGGVIPLLATASTADVAGVGSILEMLPEEFEGAVWGSGSLRGEAMELSAARFLAVRGELTKELVRGAAKAALGDPGILVSRFMKRPQRRWRVGVVPHHMHEDDPLWARLAASAPGEVKVINVRRGPSAVLRDIASCEVVLSTSLHGLITADAFGIPAVWTRREPDLWGGQFKFDDYESALTPGRTRLVSIDSAADLNSAVRHTQTVDAGLMSQRQDGLLNALRHAEFPRVSPLASLRLVRRGPKDPES